MMKKIAFLLIVLAALITACSDETTDLSGGDYLIIQGESELDEPTRIIYTDEGLTTPNSYIINGIVSVAFEVGEDVEFMFKQGTSTYRKTTAKVTEVTATGATSRAIIMVTIPAGINKALPFDLYSVVAGKQGNSDFKGNYIDSADPKYVNQHIDEDGLWRERFNSSLSDKEVSDQIIQVASVKNIQYDHTPGVVNRVSLGYKHIGALIAIAIKNDTPKLLEFNGVRLEDFGGTNWVYDKTARYNLETDSWEGPMSYYVNFYSVPTSGQKNLKYIPVRQTIPTYRWMVPTGTVPTDLKIRFSEGPSDWSSWQHQYYSPVGGPGNTFAPVPGKRYRFNRRWWQDNVTSEHHFDPI